MTLPSMTDVDAAFAAGDSFDEFSKRPLPVDQADIDKMFGVPEDHSARVVELAKVYIRVRRAKDDADEAAKKRGEEMRLAEDELNRALSSSGVPSIAIDDAGKTVTLSRSTRSLYQLPAGWKDDPGFVAWLKETAPDLVKSSVHAQSFSAHCRELVEKAASVAVEPGVPTINPLHPRVQCVELRGVQMRVS